MSVTETSRDRRWISTNRGVAHPRGRARWIVVALLLLLAVPVIAQVTGTPPEGPIAILVVPRSGDAVLIDLHSARIIRSVRPLRYAGTVTLLDEDTWFVVRSHAAAIINSDGTEVSRLDEPDFEMITSGRILDNGHVLLGDGEGKWYREYDWDGTIYWRSTGYHWPSDAQRLDNGNTLIADGTSVLKEVNENGDVVWHASLGRWALAAERLENGMTLVGESRAVELLDEDGERIWTEQFEGRMGSVCQWENGELVAVDTDNGLVVAMNIAGQRLWELDVSELIDIGYGLNTAIPWPFD